MSLRDLEIKLLSLDPYDIVDCGLDSFAPYAFLNLPDSIQEEANNLSMEDSEKWNDFCTDYVERLPMMGVKETIEYLKNHLD